MDLAFQTAYDFSGIKSFYITQDDIGTRMEQGETRYILSGGNRAIALNDIDLVCKTAKVKLNLNEIRFSAPGMEKSINSDFTHLNISSLTAKGKTPLFPLTLYFTTGDPKRSKSYFTGRFYYTRSGEIGKYIINKWTWSSYLSMERTEYKGKISK